jgi:Protein of unknown function (DUF1091)
LHSPHVAVGKITVKNSPDKEVGLVTGIWEQKLTITEAEQRMKLFRAEDLEDRDVKLYIGSASLNHCKLKNIVKKNVLINVLMENFFKSLNGNISCPFLKGTKTNLIDMEITDKYFPPIPQETRFRLEVVFFQKIQGQKKFTKIFTTQYFVSVKKSVF